MNHASEWFFYLLGAFLTLAWKWAKYCYQNPTRSLRQNSIVWFFEDSKENYVSWVTTIGIVWALGVSYITHVEWMMAGFFTAIPVQDGFAFFLGSLMELMAPATIKWIISKLPVPPQ